MEAIAEAIRQEYRNGRKHAEIARELNVSARTIGAIVWGERRVGAKTLDSIVAVNPPWLRATLVAALGKPGAEQGHRDLN
jgi:hypothetical protein